jgi:hypothetical protein
MFTELIGWKFDPVSSLVTLIIGPILIYGAIVTRKFVRSSAKYVLDGVVYSLNKSLVHRAAETLTLKRYSRMQLAGQNQFLRVPSAIDVNLKIDDMFVPLVLEQQGLTEGYDHNTVLSAGSRIRIIGDPGSAKSSIAKKIFRDECKRAMLMPRRSRFPILLELRSFDIPANTKKKILETWLYDYIRNQLEKYEVYELQKCFDAFSATRGLPIILDGLDEVASSAYPRMEAAINGLSLRLNQLSDKNIILLTMRTQFHQQVSTSYSDTFPVVLSIRRFMPSDIYEFLQRWPFSTAKKAQDVVRIYNDLADRPTLREMCTNPLVLAMYVAQDQISGESVAPDSRTDFYQKVVEELLIKRRAKQIGAIESQSIIREQRQRILGLIGFRHLLDPNQTVNRIDWRFGISVVVEVAGLKTQQAVTCLRELSKETGLITEEQEGETFRFIHLTFCEYFAAFEAIQGQRNGWDMLVETHKKFGQIPALKTRLVEVLPFASALLPRHMRTKAIANVGESEDLHLLALTFLETKLYSHELWPKFLDSFQNNLLKTDEAEWNSEWLRKVHLFLVVASDAERSAAVLPGIIRSDGVLRFFQDFASKSASAIAKLISKYSEQDAAAAFRVATLCGIDIFRTLPEIVIERSDQPPFVAVALERSAREPEKTYEWASLFAEAGLRSSAAASVLSTWPQRPWRNDVNTMPRKFWWHIPEVVRPSHFTDCLTLGCAAHNPKQEITPALFELRQIPAPNLGFRSFVTMFLFRFGFLIFMVIYLAGITIFSSLTAAMRPLVPGHYMFMPIIDRYFNFKYALLIFSFIVGGYLYFYLGAWWRLRVYVTLLNRAQTSREF